MQLMDSHIEAGQELCPKDRQAYYTAIVEYLYYGREPDLKGAAKAVFVAIKPTLDNTRARSEAGSKGGSKTQANGKQTTSKSESNGQANAEQNESKSEANGQANRNRKGNIKEDSPNGESKKAPRFAKPTVQEVAEYAAERGRPGFKASRFVDHYEANGWRIGKTPMKDWRAAVRTWLAKDDDTGGEARHAADFSAYGSVYA